MSRASLPLDAVRGAIFSLDDPFSDTEPLRRTEAVSRQGLARDRTAMASANPVDIDAQGAARRAPAGAAKKLPVEHASTPNSDLPVRAASLHRGPRDETPGTLVERLPIDRRPSTLAFAQALRARGVLTAIVTARRLDGFDADPTRLGNQFHVVVDADAIEASALPGTHTRGCLLETAARLGVTPQRCVVVDNTPEGVAAARSCGFIAIGVSDRKEELTSAGADAVVEDLGRLELGGNGPDHDARLLMDTDVDDEREGIRESLLTLGNGYIAARGARTYAEDDGKHYPGTYFAGVFDRLRSKVDSRTMDEDAIVNAPNWLALSFAMAEGPWLGTTELSIEPWGATLDLTEALLVRRYSVSDPAGRTCSVLERRLVSMADPHLAAIEMHIVAENWSGCLEIQAGLNGAVRDDETLEERLIGGLHLDLVDAYADGDQARVSVRTVQSEIILAEACRARVRGGVVTTSGSCMHARATQRFSIPVKKGQRIVCEKIVALYSSRDAAISSPLGAATRAAQRAGDFSQVLDAHQAAWARLWARAAVDVHNETEAIQRLVNLHLFHVLQVASPHVVGRDVGLGARGLHGEGYLGHIFWDELFVLPMIKRRFPTVTRSLLSYRARRLDRARDAARELGHRGAMFPWQSASDGRDETPEVLYNPRSGHWIEDRSRYQRHVGLAIAYNFWQYFESTRDEEHFFETGAEVILEIGRFFASLATYDDSDGRYHIRGVMGPDEFHDGYPWRAEPGIDDNAYTNVMTAWLLGHCLTTVELLRRSGRDELLERLQFTDDELAQFEDVSRRLAVPFFGEVIAQFAGYELLKPLDLATYKDRYGDLARLDLILEAEGDTVRRYQVGKQPDTLMLLFLFSAEELRSVLGRLGYRFGAEAIRSTIDYYSARVTHGSSLSRVVHAWISARLDRSSSWRYLSDALQADFLDLNKGTTREGIHLGAMAGTIDIFERCYPGLEIRSDALWLNPSLPEELRTVQFGVNYRGHLLRFQINQQTVTVTSPANPPTPVSVLVAGEPLLVQPGTHVLHELHAKTHQ